MCELSVKVEVKAKLDLRIWTATCPLAHLAYTHLKSTSHSSYPHLTLTLIYGLLAHVLSPGRTNFLDHSRMDATLAALHEKAQRYLQLKLERVPDRVFSKPDIYTIYHQPPHIHGAPGDLQLAFMLSRYNELKRAGFKAQKGTQDFDITRAIFYYELDRGM